MTLDGIHREALDIRIALVVGIVENGGPDLVLVPFFQTEDIVLVMVVRVEVGDVEIAIVEYYQDAFVVIEFTEESSVLIIVDAVYVWVKPNLSSSQGTVTVTLQSDASDGTLGQEISLGSTSLDEYFGEILLQEDTLSFLRQVWLHSYLDDFRFAIRIGGEVDDAAARSALSDVVQLVAGHRRHVESLDEVITLFSIAINAVVDGALVVFLEYLYVEDVLSYEYLVGHLHDLEFSVFIEDDDVVEVGTVAYEFILFESGSYESFLSVDKQLLVGFYHLGHLDGVEVAYLGLARMELAVFAFEVFKPVDGHIGHVRKVIFNLSQFCLNFHQEIIRLILIIFKNTLHLDFEQFENVFPGDFAMESILYHSLAIHLGSKEFVLERFQL